MDDPAPLHDAYEFRTTGRIGWTQMWLQLIRPTLESRYGRVEIERTNDFTSLVVSIYRHCDYYLVRYHGGAAPIADERLATLGEAERLIHRLFFAPCGATELRLLDGACLRYDLKRRWTPCQVTPCRSMCT